MIVINLKNYVYGSKALEIVRTIDIYCNKAILAVSGVDIKEISKNTTLPIYSQHVDYFEQGRGTGYILPEAIKEAGATGSLLNHSEHRVSFQKIKRTLDRCNEVGLKLIVCASSLAEAKRLIKLNIYSMAYEDPGLIASGKSITNYKTHEVKLFVELLKKTKIIPLCGAGINSSEDVKRAYGLGCKGVLVSSAIANSPHPEQFLKEISNL